MKAGRKTAEAGQEDGRQGGNGFGFIPPCLARAVREPPEGDAWVHEVKHDGYRVQAHIDNGEVRLYTRNGLDWTRRFGRLDQAFAAVPAKRAIIDGEALVTDARGASDFPALVERLRGGGQGISFVAFDLLHIDGRDITGDRLERRKAALAGLLSGQPRDAPLQFGEHMAGDGAAILAKVTEMGLEGVVSKRRDSPYRSGRQDFWTKVKGALADPFVVVGFVRHARDADRIGALVLAYREGNRLVYAGRVGSGFTQAEAEALKGGLETLRSQPPVFAESLTALQKKGAVWVEPRLVAQVEYRGWTREGLLRQASFKSLRDDKHADEIGKPAVKT